MLEFNVPADELFQRYAKRQEGQAGPVDIHSVLEIEPIKSIGGSFKLWSLNSGCLVALLDFEVVEDFSSTTPLENFYSIEIILRGNTEVCLGDHSLSNNGIPQIYLTSHGKGSRKRRVHQAGDSLRSIGIWISPVLFLENFGVDVTTLPDDVQNVLISPDSGVASFPVTSKIKQIANDIFDMSYEFQIPCEPTPIKNPAGNSGVFLIFREN